MIFSPREFFRDIWVGALAYQIASVPVPPSDPRLREEYFGLPPGLRVERAENGLPLLRGTPMQTGTYIFNPWDYLPDEEDPVMLEPEPCDCAICT